MYPREVETSKRGQHRGRREYFLYFGKSLFLIGNKVSILSIHHLEYILDRLAD